MDKERISFFTERDVGFRTLTDILALQGAHAVIKLAGAFKFCVDVSSTGLFPKMYTFADKIQFITSGKACLSLYEFHETILRGGRLYRV